MSIRLFQGKRRCTPPSAGNNRQSPISQIRARVRLPASRKGISEGWIEELILKGLLVYALTDMGLKGIYEGCIVYVCTLSRKCASHVHYRTLVLTTQCISKKSVLQYLQASPHSLWGSVGLPPTSKAIRKSSGSWPCLPRILKSKTSLVNQIVEFKWIKVLPKSF